MEGQFDLRVEMARHQEKFFVYRSFKDGQEAQRYPISYPVYLMTTALLMQTPSARALAKGTITHEWGQQVYFGPLKNAIAEFQTMLIENPEFGINDGIDWEGRHSRDVVDDLTKCLLQFNLRDDEVLVLDYMDSQPCKCSYCMGYAPPKLNIDNDSFMKEWAARLKKKG